MSFSIQFHGTTDEIIAFAEKWMAEFAIGAIAVRFPPFSASLVQRANIGSAIACPEVRRIIFTEDPPAVLASNENQLLDENAGAMVLDIGRLDSRGLFESCLSTAGASRTWGMAAQQLKKNTMAGAVAVNPKTGASARFRAHRYTIGAKDLAATGTPIRPIAGTALFKLEG